NIVAHGTLSAGCPVDRASDAASTYADGTSTTEGPHMNARSAMLAVGLGLLLAGCIVAPPPEPAVVVTPPTPPPVRVETPPPPPAPAYVWVGGHWAWRRGAYVWVPGYWATPVAPGRAWVAGHWAPRPGGYVWV